MAEGGTPPARAGATAQARGTRGAGRLGVLAAALLVVAGVPGIPGAALAAAAQGESLERLFLNELEERLAEHAFFEKVRVHLADEEAPLALFTQNPPNQRNRSFYLPWMHELVRTVHDRHLRPLGLTRRSTHAVTPVVVLANETFLRQYWKTRSAGDYAFSTWDTDLRAVVTCEASTAPWLRRRPLLRDLTLGLLDAHAPLGATPSDLWYRRGFAGYVSHHSGTRPSVLETHRPDRESVELLFEVLRRRDRRAALWIPLEVLTSVDSLSALDQEKRGEDPSEREVFDRECALWVHFFHEAQGGRYAEGAAAYLRRSLAGDGGAAAFEECFGTRDLDALEREFESHVFELYDRLFVERAPTDEEEVEEEPPPVIDLAPLQQEPTELEDVLALALWHAHCGRLERALVLLEARAPGTAGDEQAAIERELVRLRTLRAARDALLRDAIETGDKVRLQVGGERVHARPVALEDGRLRFADEEIDPVPVDAIDSVALALALGSPPGELGDELGAGWVRAYGFALGADSRWKRFLRDEGEIGRSIEADAPERLPGLVAAGRALGALSELGATEVPTNAEAAAAVLERLNRVLAELQGPQRELLDAHRDEITALARHALGLRFLHDGLQDVLHGQVEALEDGRLRLSYDFSDPAQLDDFSEVKDYLKWRIERLRRDFSSKKLEVEKGTLRGTGFHCLRHRIELAAPMSVAYEFEFEKRKASVTDAAEVMVGICDDGAGSYLGSYAQGELHVEQKKLKTFDAIGRGEEPTGFRLGYAHPMQIRHDGERASTWRAGEKRQETPVLGLTQGHVFLWVAVSGTLRFDNLVIEGTPVARSYAEMQEEWVKGEVEGMGL